MSDTVTKLILILGIVAFDLVIFFFLIRAFPVLNNSWKRKFTGFYWVISTFVLGCFWFLDLIFMGISSYSSRRLVISIIALIIISKILAGIYLLLNGIISLGAAAIRRNSKNKPAPDPGSGGDKAISRKKFLYRSALMVTSLPLAVRGFNIINQAYDYKLRRVKIQLPNLPKSFHGIKIGQISDIHSGSFKDRTAVIGGVEMLQQERPDLAFFTGDLVNRQTDEIKDYFEVFNKVQAPLGVYSILGNHDYGEYRHWPSASAKQKDFQDMLAAHKELGWQLLRNEHRLLTESGESLAILGVENWGVRRFSKYGKIKDAYAGTEHAAVRLLLSHDPSHWEAKVLDYPDIDVTFSGHTHGFQFGVEAGRFKWSPSQYLYKQWAGLYQQGHQYIYVNRGYGFLGMPGRIGIYPEVTIFELSRA